ncbi:trimeric intracellular cation channel family protein [Sinomonas terrae]|uniref:Trimeric intracellular cation channel family protein n=1 Tax=Sinomonas terrae TaxID=2908838 RepID=A0ABS9U517_9MICC|nr:trimeric intracellular cation channel family protein [Sinomonas terrae]MCH6471786.1 trimeric intracellular cation channel family protein [Sinomonas terrae]
MGFEAAAVFDVVDLVGVLANGILGGAVARQLRFDPIGFLVLAVLSALGGGMMRDTLLQHGFPVALTNPAYLVTAVLGAAVAFLVRLDGVWATRVLLVVDSLSLGCWSATGTAKALGVGLGWLPAMLLGLLTAVGGGMVRDIAVGRLPAIFGGNTLYATGALIGSAEMALLYPLGQQNLGFGLAIVTGSAVSLVARRRGWRLPEPVELRLGALPGLRWSRRRPDDDRTDESQVD